jgi:hypothetical protein
MAHAGNPAFFLNVVVPHQRDATGWLRTSARGRTFWMAPEPVLDHRLPVVAFGDGPGLPVKVRQPEPPFWQALVEDN